MNCRENTSREKSLICLFGVCLCGILLFFAVTTKLAGYRTQEQSAKQIAAMHIWQDGDKAPIPFGQSTLMPVVIALVACIALFVAKLKWFPRTGEPKVTSHPWFSADLSVRPPPAL